MPYIDTDTVKQIRNKIKTEFGNDFQISVRREHSSTVNVTFLSGCINLIKDLNSNRRHEQVNEYYIEEHYKDMPEACEVLKY